MAQRRVFGKGSQTQRDTFASMLYSSPEMISTKDDTKQCKTSGSASRPVPAERLSQQKHTATVLQPVSGNVSLPAKDRSCTKAVTGQRRSRTVVEVKDVKPIEERARATHTARQQHNTRKTKRISQKEVTPVKPEPSAKPQNTTQPSTTTLKDRHFDDVVYEEHCRSLLDVCQQAIEDFSEWSARLSQHLDIAKIAEASYGEVYRLSLKPSLDEDTGSHDESVLKVIALTPPECTLPNTKRERNRALKKISMMSKPHDVACEVRLLQRMSTIPGFTDFREMTILKGRPPPAIVKAYKTYNKTQLAAEKDASTFPDPAKKSSYAQDQLWAVIEMRDAGTDLERLLELGKCQDISSAWDIFWQVALALAKGEEAAQFEHRDLHLGNICIKTKPRSTRSKKLHYTDLHVTLIDYTISRATIDDGVAFMDLSKDEHLFTADSTYEYQYDIYRYMRSALFLDCPLAEFEDQETSRSWLQFHPQTNLVWLHFVLYMLLEQAIDTTKQEKKLRRILLKVSEMLDPEVVMKNGLTSTGILIATALNNGWLDEEDVIGVEETLILDELVDNFAALSA